MFHAKGLLYIAKGAMLASPPSSRRMLFTTVCKVPTPGTLKRKGSLAFNHSKDIFFFFVFGAHDLSPPTRQSLCCISQPWVIFHMEAIHNIESSYTPVIFKINQ